MSTTPHPFVINPQNFARRFQQAEFDFLIEDKLIRKGHRGRMCDPCLHGVHDACATGKRCSCIHREPLTAGEREFA